MDKTKVVEMIKKAETALRSAHREQEALASQLESQKPKLAHLEELEAREQKRERVIKIAERMVEAGRCAPEEKLEKVGELMGVSDLDTVERALDMLDSGEGLSLGDLGKEASGMTPEDQFWATFLDLK